MTVGNSDLSPLLSQLRSSWAVARNGAGSICFFSDPQGENFDLITRELQESFPKDNIQSADLIDCIEKPYSPLPLYIPKDKINLNQVYFRHRSLWTSWIEEKLSPPKEDLINEECSYERQHLETELLNHLGSGIFFCRNAQELPPETILLLSQEDQFTNRPIMILLCFQHDPWEELPELLNESFFRTRFSQGRVITLGTKLAAAERAKPLPPGKSSLPALELLHQWMCYDHCLALGNKLHDLFQGDSSLLDQDDQYRLYFILARCYEDKEEYDKGLFFAQTLSSVIGNEKDQIFFVDTQLLLARLLKGVNDREAAIQAAYLAWKSLRESQDRSLRTKIDFTLFLLNSQDPEYKDAYENLHDRLIDELITLGWRNHLAYVLTQNMAVMEMYWKSGWNQAHTRCQWGLDTSLELGNTRRLVTAYHSMATLFQIQGEFTKAEKFFLKAAENLKGVSKPYEEARNDNGIGYFYFVLGRYKQAFQKHARALSRLFRTRYYIETLSTLINLARIYLFNRQFDQGLGLMEDVFQILDRLRIPDIPFHPQRNLFSLMGLLCINSGQISRAQEFYRKIQFLPQPRRMLHSADYQLFFEGEFFAHRGEQEKAKEKFESAVVLMEQKAAESSHLLIQVLISYGMALRTWGLEDQAKTKWTRALELCGSGHVQEKDAIQVLITGSSPPTPPPLPEVDFDSEVVIQFVDQDASMNRLQRKVREFSFLQKWQDLLKQDLNIDEILTNCCALIRQHFTVSEVLALPAPPSIPDRRDLNLFLEIEFKANPDKPQLFSGQDLPEGFTSLSYLPISYEGHVRIILISAARGLRQHLGEEDHNLLVMASRELSVSLLAALRSSQLAVRQADLERSNRELTQTLATLREAQSQLVQAEKMSALGNLVAGVAHEINTPLGVAITAVSYLKEKSMTLIDALKSNQLKKSDLDKFVQQNAESAEMVLRNLTRAEELIQSFKQVAADQSSEHRRSFDIKEYLDEVLVSLRPKWKKSRIQVRVEGAEGITIDTYPGAIAQIITNLLINSLLHAFGPDDEGTITIKVSKEDDQVLLVFEDNGSGISSENLGKIFEPFFTTKRGQGGTGLGLHIVFNLVNQRLGGTIKCESYGGMGTRFLITMPVRPM